MGRKAAEPNPLKELHDWFRDIPNFSNKLIIGIDPGADGAIGLIYGDSYHVFDIPNLKVKRGKGKKTVFNLPLINQIFKRIEFLFTKWCENDVYCIIEQPPPSMGPKSSGYAQFRLGVAYAMWPLFLHSFENFRIEEVSPGAWKKKMGLSSDKETSRSKALGMFPKASLQRKKDHNRAEGLLLAEFQTRKLKGA